MIDSHTHLGSCSGDPAQLVADARAAGVRRMLTVGTDGPSSRAALADAERFEEVLAAVGRHPNEATGFGNAELAELEELATHPRCAAIGETGLDFYRDGAPHADQARAFAAQIDLARATAKPLVIHSRDAGDETVATLRARAHGVRIVLHCFSMPEQLDACLAEGWWISFAGNVTYPRSEALAAAVPRVPDDRLLVETDAPYLTPQAVRRQRNQPAFVVHTAAFAAERRGTSLDALEAVVDRNAAALFGW